MNNIESIRISQAENGYIVELKKIVKRQGLQGIIEIISGKGFQEPGEEWKKDLPGNVQPAPEEKPYEVHVFATQEEMMAFVQKYSAKN